jgi:hypothetical protein
MAGFHRRMLHLVGSSAVVVRNVTLQNSGFWMMHLQFCERVLIDGVAMFNPNTPSYEAPNGGACVRAGGRACLRERVILTVVLNVDDGIGMSRLNRTRLN